MSAITAHDEVVPPKCYVFDAYYHFDTLEWFCTALELPKTAVPDAERITETEARKIATDAVNGFTKRINIEGRAAEVRFQGTRTKRVEIPWPNSAGAAVEYRVI